MSKPAATRSVPVAAPTTGTADRGRGRSRGRAAGWWLVIGSLVAAVIGVLTGGWPQMVAGWIGWSADDVAHWGPLAALGVSAVIGLVVGLLLIARAAAGAVAQTAEPTATGNRLVEVTAEAEAELDQSDAADPAGTADWPAYWPADQAVGQGWQRASDAIK